MLGFSTRQSFQFEIAWVTTGLACSPHIEMAVYDDNATGMFVEHMTYSFQLKW